MDFIKVLQEANLIEKNFDVQKKLHGVFSFSKTQTTPFTS